MLKLYSNFPGALKIDFFLKSYMLSYIFIPNELTFKVKNERKTAYTAIQPSSNSHQKFIFAKKKKKSYTKYSLNNNCKVGKYVIRHKIFPWHIKLLNLIKIIIKNSKFMILWHFNYLRKCLDIVIILKHELY